jgi:beta-xylosidase
MNPAGVYLFTAAFYLAGCFGQLSGAQSELQPGAILNPLGDPPLRLQEPFVFCDAKKYFLFGTASPSQGFQCYESADLVHWKLDGWAWRLSALRVARDDLHSPQVFLYDGMFCMVYSARVPTGHKLALAASVQPQGPYHDLHVPWLGLPPDCTAGNVFVDDNRKAYLTFSQPDPGAAGATSIYAVALNGDLSKTVTQPVILLRSDQRWESSAKDRKSSLEAARIFRIGSKYYLTYSAIDPRTSESAIGYATADRPLGPWTKNSDNPLLSTRPQSGILRPGRSSVFRSLDRHDWFMVYQSFDDSTPGSEGPVINIDQVVLQGIRQLGIVNSARRRSIAPAAAAK